MLSNATAQRLYDNYTCGMPIFDYHNHLSAKQIAENYTPPSITQMWLGADHYKWRLLRANGVEERYITGESSDYEKFEKWAQTLPYAMRNPIYHWSHLELKRYFGEDRLLTPESCREIYDACNAKIAEGGYGAMDLLRRMNVRTVCTTDDPIDTLEYHAKANAQQSDVRVLPTWRPDRVVAIDRVDFVDYLSTLGDVAGVEITNFDRLLEALEIRQQHFVESGCLVSDHGLDRLYAEEFSPTQVNSILCAALTGEELTKQDVVIYKSAILYHLALMNHRVGWVQQFHVGPLRNASTRLFNALGADVGGDSIDDKPIAEDLKRFFDSLDVRNSLSKTILYNLNPKDSEVMATMCYNFNDGSCVGKMQYGAAWWFLDQVDGMTKQIETLSSLGLLSRFVGMLTDSRSFLSFPRHEYFRRILCNILGEDIEQGRLPASQEKFIGEVIKDICYNNACRFFSNK